MTTPVSGTSVVESSVPQPVSQLRPIALQLESAPVEIGGVYSKINFASIADSGEVAFGASLLDSTASSAILMDSGGTTRVLLRDGDLAPGGGRFKNFGELDLSVYTVRPVEGNRTFLMFQGEVEDGAVPEGLFLWTPNGVEAVALSGGNSPRGNTYKSFTQPTVIALNNNFGIRPLWAFVAVMGNGNKSVVIYPGFGEAMEVLSTGDKLGKSVVEDFVISRMGGFALSCIAEMRDRKNGKRFRQVLILTEDSVFWGDLKEKTRFEGLGRVKRLSVPSAISLQSGYIALEFKNGTSSIAVKNIIRAPAIIAKSGDPAPCAPGETIESFGPPIVNANFPSAHDLAVISTVRLSGGRSAVWAYIVKDADRTAETKLLLAEGNGCGNNQPLVLHSLSPLKMSNNGGLLLRGKSGDADAVREGIFVLDNLFD